MTSSDLNTKEYNPYYGTYISQVPKDVTLTEGFHKGRDAVVDFFKSIPEDTLDYRYASDKWTVKEVFQHIIDTEQIFMYRCLRIARRDTSPLMGFEQDDYIVPSRANEKSLEDLLEEYLAVRQNFMVFLKSLNNDDLMAVGIASESPLSARAAAFIVLGHEKHHMQVIEARYL